ncbi:hypothetical protein [Arthrobacter sp. E3]|uniref:hypothetical protein n=1 Tax=Arthrobacter sp. E3 TaxID=517402 RepID=UPI001A952155|nr:hypothetical protein [Arthrobacter sp. E3]
MVAFTYSLLPGQVELPPGAPIDHGSVDRTSTVALFTSPYAVDNYSARLSWDWDVVSGNSQATLFAVVRSRTAQGSLVLGGPVSQLVEACFINGAPTALSQGMPNTLGFPLPEKARFWFETRPEDKVMRVDFQGDPGPGGVVIICEVRGFSSDVPPDHYLYSPMLTAYADGSGAVTEEDLSAAEVCVSTNNAQDFQVLRECADTLNLVPKVEAQEQMINLPQEQGIRETHLILIGALAGVAAATLFDIVNSLLKLIRIPKRKSSPRT